jgi:hypothetical protein
MSLLSIRSSGVYHLVPVWHVYLHGREGTSLGIECSLAYALRFLVLYGNEESVNIWCWTCRKLQFFCN